MEAVNESTKLVAQSLDKLKEHLQALDDHETWEDVLIKEAISMLEIALEKLLLHK